MTSSHKDDMTLLELSGAMAVAPSSDQRPVPAVRTMSPTAIAAQRITVSSNTQRTVSPIPIPAQRSVSPLPHAQQRTISPSIAQMRSSPSNLSTPPLSPTRSNESKVRKIHQ